MTFVFFSSLLTSLEEMIWLSVQNTNGPPRWLGLLRIHTLRYTGNDFASVIREVNLFPRFHEFNV
jgi:hypothetical protein